jgi:XTP/dITP diphosphohydrolase
VKLLLASGNAKKREELTSLLAALDVEVLGPADVGGLPEVVEDGDTFEANARKKAVSAAKTAGLWSLADDSGLCVDALDGAPGVRSARFAGPEAVDAENNARLLRELDGLAAEGRGAHFRCVLALADPNGEVVATFEGRTHGRILEAPRGEQGFGYDPLFLFAEEGLPQTGRTFAELSGGEKSDVSHRGRALAELARRFADLVATAEA